MSTRMFAVLLLVAISVMSPHSGVAAQRDTSAIDRFLTTQLAAQRVPGLALAVVHANQVVYLKGYGTAGDGAPVTPHTQFFIASVSKSITALAVIQLAEAHTIDLDAPVQRYLPDFTLADADHAARLTVRQLLNQVSGLADAGFPEGMLPQPATIAERVQSLRDARPVAPPGTEFHYFNPNYAVLARLVEVVSGQPFAEYLHTSIFTPLEMNRSFAAATSAQAIEQAENLAQGHIVVFGMPLPVREMDGFLGGSGGVISTAADMAHFVIAQLQDGRFKGHALASPAAFAAMHTPPPYSTSHYAMGWFAQQENGTRTVEHNGVLSTFYSEAVLLPDTGYGFVLLANANGATSAFLGYQQIKRGLIDLLSGKQPSVSPVTVGRIGVGMGVLTVVGVALALRGLWRLPRWKQQHGQRSAWRSVPGIVCAFTPGVVLLALPALLMPLADRAFDHATLVRSMPDVVIWLGATGLLGAINGMGRLIWAGQRFVC